MATSLLRQPLIAPVPGAPLLEDGTEGRNQLHEDQVAAASGNQFTNALRSSDLGNDIGSLAAQESSLRASGDVAGGNALRQQIQALQARQTIYAPAVGRLRDIRLTEPGGVGRAGDWAAAQMGNGVGSSIDPMLVGTGMGAAGNAIGMIKHPIAQGISTGLRLAAPAVMGGMFYKPMKGEAYNQMVEDPAIAAKYTPQQLDTRASLLGAGNAALGTIVPGMLASKIAGAGVKAGVAAKLNPFSQTAVSAGEMGATMAGQTALTDTALHAMNPDRPRTGPEDYADAFAGGAASVVPHGLVAGAAHSGWTRLGVKGDGKNGDKIRLIDALKGAANDMSSEEKAAYQSVLTGSKLDDMDMASPDFEAQSRTLTPERKAALLDGLSKLGTTEAKELHKKVASVDDTVFDNYEAPVFDEAAALLVGKAGLMSPAEMAKYAKAGKQNSMQGVPVDPSDLGAKKGAVPDLPAGTPGTAEWRADPRKTFDALTNFNARMIRYHAESADRSTLDVIDRVGSDIAAMASPGVADSPTPIELRRAETAGRAAATVLGPKVESVLSIIGDRNGITKTPIFKAMFDTAVSLHDGSVTHATEAVRRDEAAQELVKLVPLNRATDLLQAGVDISHPKVATRLLNAVEALHQGDQTQRMEMNKRFGKKTIDAMLEQIDTGPAIEPRHGEVQSTSGKTAGTDSDTAGTKNESEQELSDFDRGMEQKSQDKSAPDAQLFFHKGADKARSIADWIGTKSTTNEKGAQETSLPTLAGLEDKLDAKHPEAGKNALLHAEDYARSALGLPSRADQKASEAVGVHGSHSVMTMSAKDVLDRGNVPDSKREDLMLRYMKKDGAENVDGLSELVAQHRQLKAMDRHLTEVADGRPSLGPDGEKLGAVEKAQMKSLVINHAKIAELALPADKALADTLKDMTPQGQAVNTAAIVHRALAAKTAELAEHPVFKPFADKYRTEQGTEPHFGNLADDYFKDKHLVVAQQGTNDDHLKMNRADALRMTDMGARNLKEAALAGSKAMGGKEIKGNHTLSEAAGKNLIRFASPLSKGESGEVAVPANLLVKWVRDGRNAHEANVKVGPDTSSKTATKRTLAYRNDLMEGISAFIDSGHVEAGTMPYIINHKGEREDFVAGDIKGRSKSVMHMNAEGRLATSTAGRPSYTPRVGEKMGATGWKTAIFGNGELPPSLDLGGVSHSKFSEDREISAARRRGERELLMARNPRLANDIARREEYLKDLELTKETPDPQSMDAVEKAAQEADGSKTREDQREHHEMERSIQEAAADAEVQPLKKNSPFAASKRIAEGLWRSYALSDDRQGGVDRILSYLRSMERPESKFEGEEQGRRSGVVGEGVSDPNMMLGGGHYVEPLAALLTPSRMAWIKANDPQNLRLMLELRSHVAAVLAGQKNSPKVGLMVHSLSGFSEGGDGFVKSVERKAWLEKLAARHEAVTGRKDEQLKTNKEALPSTDPTTGVADKPLDRASELPKNPNMADYTAEQIAQREAAVKNSPGYEAEEQKAASAAAAEARKNEKPGFGIGTHVPVPRTPAAEPESRKMTVKDRREARLRGRAEAARKAAHESVTEGRTQRKAPFINKTTLDADTTEARGRVDTMIDRLTAKPLAPETTEKLTAAEFEKKVAEKQEQSSSLNELPGAPTAPPKFQAKETAKMTGADLVLAPTSATTGYAGELARWAKVVGRLFSPLKDTDLTGKTVYASVPGANRGWTGIAAMIERAKMVIERGGTLRTDDKANAVRPHNASGEGALRAALVKAGYEEKARDGFSEWVKAEAPKTPGMEGEPAPNLKQSNDQVVNAVGTQTPTGEKNTAAPIQAVPDDREVNKATAYFKKSHPQLEAVFKAAFPDMKGSADYDAIKRIARIATASPVSIMQRAYHEGMHDFFAHILDKSPTARDMLLGVATDQRMIDRMGAMLKGSPEAIKALADPQEALSYMYQFWAADMLKVGKKPEGFFQHIQAFFRKISGTVSANDKALAIFEALHKGELAEPSAAGLAIDRIMQTDSWRQKFLKKFDAASQAAYTETMAAINVSRNQDYSETARKIGAMFFAHMADPETADTPGYINITDIRRKQYDNHFQAILKPFYGDNMRQDLLDLAQALNSQQPAVQPHVQKAVDQIHALLDHFHQYAKEAGLDLGVRDKGSYFPRVYDLEHMVENKEAFTDMLVDKYGHVLTSGLPAMSKADASITTLKDAADRVFQMFLDHGGVDENKLMANREDGVLNPFFASLNERALYWLRAEDVAPFLSKDPVSTMSRYFNQGVRSVEYTRKFGQGGQKLKDMMARAGDVQMFDKNGSAVLYKTDGPVITEMKAAAAKLKLTPEKSDEWINRRYEDLQRSFGAMEGSLGKDISYGWRSAQGAMMAYQTVRTLPLSLFSAMLDPNGIRVAGGTGKNMFDAYVRGAKAVFKIWKDLAVGNPLGVRDVDKWEAAAMTAGVLDPNMFLEEMGGVATSEYVAGAARKINHKFFLGNGITAWDRAMRTEAVKAAMEHIVASERDTIPAHSARWLRELGLQQGDGMIRTDNVGDLIVDRHKLAALRAKENGTESKAELARATKDVEKIHVALNRWVNRAIMSPNAALRPTRASDPHYAMFYQLKSFTYAFQESTLKYAMHEARMGNLNSGVQLLRGLPIMIAADVSKAILTGGGSLPGYMANWTMADWLFHATNRSGMTGVPQFGLDALGSPHGALVGAASVVGGPTISQGIDAFTHPLGETIMGAIPGINKIGGVVKGASGMLDMGEG